MIDLSPGNLKRLLLEAVDLKGEDYIYTRSEIHPESCMYLDYAPAQSQGDVPSPTGKPACIMGHVLMAAGVTAEWLYKNENQAVSQLITSLHMQGLATKPSRKTLDTLDSIQEAQDTGEPWGIAVNQNIRYII